ncbi:MAG: hypothetical protein R6X33_13745 [Candidatus Brocadiia bacterium]
MRTRKEVFLQRIDRRVEESEPPFSMPPPVDGGMPPAWGACAPTHAPVRGLVGVHDEGRNMDALRLTSHWGAAGVREATACIKYEEGEGCVRCHHGCDDGAPRMSLAASAEQRSLEVLMPEGRQPAAAEPTEAVPTRPASAPSGSERTRPSHWSAP